MIFHDFTVLATGDIHSRRKHESKSLVPRAVKIFAEMLASGGDEFHAHMPGSLSRICVDWKQEPEAATCSFWSHHIPMTVSALLTGKDAEADREALATIQAFIVAMLKGGPLEPGFAVLAITERPVIITVPLPVHPRYAADMGLIADCETCIAAAYFERELS